VCRQLNGGSGDETMTLSQQRQIGGVWQEENGTENRSLGLRCAANNQCAAGFYVIGPVRTCCSINGTYLFCSELACRLFIHILIKFKTRVKNSKSKQ